MTIHKDRRLGARTQCGVKRRSTLSGVHDRTRRHGGQLLRYLKFGGEIGKQLQGRGVTQHSGEVNGERPRIECHRRRPVGVAQQIAEVELGHGHLVVTQGHSGRLLKAIVAHRLTLSAALGQPAVGVVVVGDEPEPFVEFAGTDVVVCDLEEDVPAAVASCVAGQRPDNGAP